MSCRRTGPSATFFFQSLLFHLRLGVWALICAIVIGVPLGCLAGLKKDGPVDAVLRVFFGSGNFCSGFVVLRFL